MKAILEAGWKSHSRDHLIQFHPPRAANCSNSWQSRIGLCIVAQDVSYFFVLLDKLSEESITSALSAPQNTDENTFPRQKDKNFII
jgi:hypothetical protein